MAEPKVYPKGIMFFEKNAKAPDFVLGSMVISLNDLVQFAKDNPEYLSEYKGQKQLRLQILTGNKGIYATVDTYKAGAKKEAATDDLPF